MPASHSTLNAQRSTLNAQHSTPPCAASHATCAQGSHAHQRPHPPQDHHRALGIGLLFGLGPLQGPMYRATVGSKGGGFSYHRGTPVRIWRTGASSRGTAAGAPPCAAPQVTCTALVFAVYRGTSLIRKCPLPLGPPQGPRHSPTVGSCKALLPVQPARRRDDQNPGGWTRDRLDAPAGEGGVETAQMPHHAPPCAAQH